MDDGGYHKVECGSSNREVFPAAIAGSAGTTMVTHARGCVDPVESEEGSFKPPICRSGWVILLWGVVAGNRFSSREALTLSVRSDIIRPGA